MNDSRHSASSQGTRLLAMVAVLALVGGLVWWQFLREPVPASPESNGKGPSTEQANNGGADGKGDGRSSSATAKGQREAAARKHQTVTVQGKVVYERGGVPAVGATVIIRTEARGVEVDRTRSDAEGNFSLAGPMVGPHALFAYDGEHVSFDGGEAGHLLNIAPGTKEVGPIKLVLHRGLPIVVMVRDRGTGEGIGGASVTLSQELTVAAETGAGGEARLSVPGGIWRLGAEAEGYASEEMVIQVRKGKSNRFLLDLSRSGHLGGVVLDERRQPVADARVVVRQESRELVLASDEEGAFETDTLKPGVPFRLLAVAPGYGASQDAGYVIPRDSASLEVELVLRGTDTPLEPLEVEGVVLDETGSPVAQALVKPYPDLDASIAATTTDDRGRFFIALPRATIRTELWVEALGYLPTRVGLNPYGNPPGEQFVRVVVMSANTASGYVFDVAGESIQGARVWASAEGFGGSAAPLPSTETTVDGGFELLGLPPEFTIHAWAAGYGTVQAGPFTEPMDDLELVLEPGHVLDLRVAEMGSARPISQFKVSLIDDGASSGNRASQPFSRLADYPDAGFAALLAGEIFVSDVQGRLYLENLPSDVVLRVEVTAEGYSPSRPQELKTAPPDRVQPRTIFLDRGEVRVAGRVRSGQGMGVPAGLSLWLAALPETVPAPDFWPLDRGGGGAGDAYRRQDLATNGMFSFENVPADRHLALAVCDGTRPLAMMPLSIETDSRSHENIDFVVAPGTVVAIIDRASYPNATTVSISRQGKPLATQDVGFSSTRTSLTFEDLMPFTYEVILDREDPREGPLAPVTEVAQLSLGQRHTVVFQTKPTSKVEGRITVDGLPYAAKPVFLFDMIGNPPLEAYTDNGGRFGFETVPIGMHLVVAPGSDRIGRLHDHGRSATIHVTEAPFFQEFDFDETITVRGRIVDCLVTRVQLQGQSGNAARFLSATLNGEGSFAIGGVAPGTYRLHTDCPPSPTGNLIPVGSAFTVPEDSDDIDLGDISPFADARLEVQLRPLTSHLSGAQVLLDVFDGSGRLLMSQSGRPADGAMVFAGLPDASVRLVAKPDGGQPFRPEPGEQWIELQRGETTAIEVALRSITP